MKCVDPAAMTETERLADIADLLGRGIQRLLLAEFKARTQSRISHDGLDVLGPTEAPCRSHALNPKSREPAA